MQRQEVKKFTLKLSEESWQEVLKNGLIYEFDTETEHTGFYQVNAAVCIDGNCGTTSDVINNSANK